MKRTLFICLLAAALPVAAQKRVADLPAATSLTGSEKVLIEQNGTTKTTTVDAMGGGATTTHYTPEAYGAAADGSTDDGAAFQAMITAAPEGSTVVLSAAHYRVNTSVTVSKKLKFVGTGPEDALFSKYGTKISTTSGTINVFKVTAPGVIFEDIAFVNSAGTTPTAGSAIRFDNDSGDYNQNPNSFDIFRCSFRGFYDNVHVENGAEWSISKSILHQGVRAGLYIANALLPDGGDAAISDCQFIGGRAATSVSIYQVSGGGLKVSNTKFNGARGAGVNPAYHYYGTFNGQTSILMFTGCSFENYSNTGVYLRGNALFEFYAMITGCQFSPYVGGAKSIDIDDVDRVSIVGNTINAAALHLSNVDICTLMNTKYNTTYTLTNVTNLNNLDAP